MDISKIRHLGFDPQVDLATGLARVVESHQRAEASELARI
jgi:nucleoside-diphosphate-sugar epimerase